jgi:ribokinase
MRFGDKIPYESVVVVPAAGNSPNAATSAARLGLKTALITNLGQDETGQEALETLAGNNVDLRFARQHPDKKTNYHYVLQYDSERTILVKHEAFSYSLPPDFVAGPPPRWIYLSSLGENSLPFHQEILDYLEKNPEVKLAFQPGTYQLKLGRHQLARVYQAADLFFCNKDESKRILETAETDIIKLLEGIHELGPKTVVISDGSRGAYAYHQGEIWFIPIYQDATPPVDRTGAGDAFSSTFTAAIAFGKSIPEAIEWGPVNSMSVVQHIGAQKGLLTRVKLEEYLAKRPADYVAKKLK